MTLEDIEAGRAALRRHAWADAAEALRSADEAGLLAAGDLEMLSEAEWWAGHPDEATDALERAFAGHHEARSPDAAARVALRLAYMAFQRLAGSVGVGWLTRAEELLGSAPETGAHAWLHVFRAFMALRQDQVDDAIDHADRATVVARRYDVPDAHAMALSCKGLAAVARGSWREGMALVDEAATAVMSGDFDLRVASDIWCITIGICRDTGDLERTGQWADQAERWMRRQGVGGYPGICQVHRAELKMLRGEWTEAEQDARLACRELERFRIMDGLGFAHYEVGEVRLRMGDLAVAEDALDRAYEYGHQAQPASALMQLAAGEVEEAARAIGRALDPRPGASGPTDLASRARLLPAQVEIALARGDVETAGKAATELEAIAADFDRPMFRAGALTARGSLLLHHGEAAEAASVLDRAWRLWQETGMPYEGARARVLYAQALSTEGDPAAARRDLRAARAVFERLGANLEVKRTDALLADSETRATAPVRRAERTFMFTDIVTSTDLVSLIGDGAWEELLRWHDRELRASFAGHRGEEVDHTGDGFFVAFERAVDGVECAVDIQRRLARHRRDHGFAPWIRIGLHAAESTRRGKDYSGKGVHVAARIGAAATSEGILVSREVVEVAGPLRFPLSEPRSLALKGVREPVTVHELDWR